MQRSPVYAPMPTALVPSCRGKPPARRGLACVALLLAAAGCSVSGDDTPQGPGTSYSSYVSDVTAAILAYEERCGLLDPSREAQRKVLLMTGYPQYLTDVRDTAAKNGRVSYDSSCLVNGLKDAACSVQRVDGVRSACVGKESSGRVADGRLCSLPEECKGFCKGVPNGTACGSGTCTAKGKVGDPCPEGARACDTAIAACSGGSCLPRGGASASCKENTECQDNLSCVRTSAGVASGSCGTAKLGKAGEACDLLEQVGKGCASGLSCYQDAMMNYVCQPVVKEGGDCRSSESCDGARTCVRKNLMDAMGKCTALGKPNDLCDADPNTGSQCQLTLRCYAPDMMSQALCVPQPENNQRCYGTLPCLLGVCDTTCRPLSGTGLACKTGSECQTGLCDPDKHTCQAPICK